MNKAELASWLIKRIGGKVSEITNTDLSEDALQMVGEDIDSYLGILKDIVVEVITP